VTDGRDGLPEIANYRVLRQLGSGGMGAVYLARRDGFSRLCAVKVMRAELELQPQNVRRFWREVRVLMMQDHPGIVRLVDAGRTLSGHLFLATELVAGRDLFQVIQRARALPVPLWLCLADQLLTALAAAHELDVDGRRVGLVHRDIKPENVMIAWEGRVVVLDFGLAQARGEAGRTRITRPGQVMGTPKYMAPEQIVEPESVGPRTDQYAAALVLYHAAIGRTTGRDLPNGEDGAPVADLWTRLIEPNWPPLSRLAPGVPEALDEVFARAMALEPSDRFGTVDRFRRALLEASGVEAAGPAELGAHVQRAFPEEALDPDLSGSDLTAAPLEPTSLASGALHEGTALASRRVAGEPPAGPPLRRGRISVLLGAVAVVVGAFALATTPPVRAPSSGEPIRRGPRVQPLPVAKQAIEARGTREPTRVESQPSAQRRPGPPTPVGEAVEGPAKAAPSKIRSIRRADGPRAPPEAGAAAAPRPRPAPEPSESSSEASVFDAVEAALEDGDETAAARALRALRGRVSQRSWACIVQALKTQTAAEVMQSCR